MTPLQRITKVMEHYYKLGHNSERINELYFFIKKSIKNLYIKKIALYLYHNNQTNRNYEVRNNIQKQNNY